MRVWFLKESNSICASCGTGCNIVMASRENHVYRYEPRANDAVNSCWMCDFGRLNYKWINRDDRLDRVEGLKLRLENQEIAWPTVLKEISAALKEAPPDSVAIIASARQTNEELYSLRRSLRRWGRSPTAFREPERPISCWSARTEIPTAWAQGSLEFRRRKWDQILGKSQRAFARATSKH